ncbi:MAG: MBL fold metallo-hydrolase RNA specificity domain-containing protein [Gammaproteobacteria bacterium]
MIIKSLSAVGEVTGSCHLIEVNGNKLLLDCGLIQGRTSDEARNREPFPFEPETIDAVILSHAHIDHSGRLPLLVKSGFKGAIYTHRATKDLCKVMLKDSASLQERDVEWENRKRQLKHLPMVEALYDLDDVRVTLKQLKGMEYDQSQIILPGIRVTLQDAGHILGSSIIELFLEESGTRRKVVFSGDLGQNDVPILRNVTPVTDADFVIMESTYGDRLHRTMDSSVEEIKDVLNTAYTRNGNILIQAFAVGRSQELLYLFKKYYKEWRMDRWQIFLDSPMAIDASRVYVKHNDLHDHEAMKLWGHEDLNSLLPNLTLTHTTNQSMNLNNVRSGAIIIAGSGMCTGGRIRHHFKHNIWRDDCHVVISGFQAKGTLGRKLVDGAQQIRLWGETMKVGAKIHTIGALSAHADQDGLIEWYKHFSSRPPVLLVHGETDALDTFATRLRDELNAPVSIANPNKETDLITL